MAITYLKEWNQSLSLQLPPSLCGGLGWDFLLPPPWERVHGAGRWLHPACPASPAAPCPHPTARGLLSTHQGLSWLRTPALKSSIPFPVDQPEELPYSTTVTYGCVRNTGPLLSSQLRNIFTFQAEETLSCSRRVRGASRI